MTSSRGGGGEGRVLLLPPPQEFACRLKIEHGYQSYVLSSSLVCNRLRSRNLTEGRTIVAIAEVCFHVITKLLETGFVIFNARLCFGVLLCSAVWF